ncbi:MAG TPA: hypothetical protein ENH86_00730 [Candidatus Jorgensenbacteria bacterium]|nr:hypothetical protein [Candidatus Jorgensenbacteria bacterium]
MGTGIIELAIVVFIAAVLGIVAKFLRQPTILAYLAAGAVIGYFGFFNFDDREIFQIFSDLGIMFLLFLVGLEINYTSLRLVGKTSLIVGLGQILFTSVIGFVLATLFGLAPLAAGYIAVALTFSSTIIVIQLLSSKKALNSLYGKISIGLLLVQDFVAILLLVVLAGIEVGGALVPIDIVWAIVKGVLLFFLIMFLGRRFFPWLFHKIAHSQELLFISSLAWLFFLVAAVERVGFSVEIGGFLAGLALANSSEHFEISSRMRSLRDFFIVMFFAILGSSVLLSNFTGLLIPIIVLSLFVLIGNPLIVIALMGFLGYTKRISFLAGLTVAQISEFSLIIAALGFRLGHITDETVAIITAVGVITITVSTYFIMHADKLFKLFAPYLTVFERKHLRHKDMLVDDLSKPIILIGCHRTGEGILAHVPKKDLLIIDFDPDVIERFKKRGYNCLFGDISDFEIFEQVTFGSARLVISTSPRFEDNLALIKEVRYLADEAGNRTLRIVVRAENEQEARMLYDARADYVLMPQFISGHYLSQVLRDDPQLTSLQKMKKRDMQTMDKESAT